MASRDPALLHPLIRPLHDLAHAKWQQSGLDVLTICTWRSNAEQALEWAKGRSAPGPIVTYRRPGESNHNFTVDGKPASLAFDCVPIVNGRLDWDRKDPIWHELADIAKSCGLVWAGDWKSFPEFPHFELPNADAIRTHAAGVKAA